MTIPIDAFPTARGDACSTDALHVADREDCNLDAGDMICKSGMMREPSGRSLPLTCRQRVLERSIAHCSPNESGTRTCGHGAKSLGGGVGGISADDPANGSEQRHGPRGNRKSDEGYGRAGGCWSRVHQRRRDQFGRWPRSTVAAPLRVRGWRRACGRQHWPRLWRWPAGLVLNALGPSGRETAPSQPRNERQRDNTKSVLSRRLQKRRPPQGIPANSAEPPREHTPCQQN